MFFSPVNSLACPQGQHINVYVTAHVIRHSLKNYKQWDYESLLGWNYIQFFPTDSPYGLFVWPFCSLRSLPSPTDHTWPLPETAAGGAFPSHTPSLAARWQQRPAGLPHAGAEVPTSPTPPGICQSLPAPHQTRQQHPAPTVSRASRSDVTPIYQPKQLILSRNQKSHFCRPTYQDGNFWESGGRSGFG